MFDGIVGKVEEQLSQAMGIGGHCRRFASSQFHGDTGRLGQKLGIGKVLAHYLIEGNNLQIKRDLAGVGFCQE